jgi:hypothetical protein
MQKLGEGYSPRSETGTPFLPRGLREATEERSRATHTATDSYGAYTLAVRGKHGGVGTGEPASTSFSEESWRWPL